MFHVSSPSEVVASPLFCITLYANETYALAAPHNKFTRVEMRCIGRAWNYVLAPPGTHADGNGRGQAPVETVAYNTRSLLEQVTPNCPFVGEPKRLSSSSSSSFSLKHSLGCVVSSKWNFFLLHRSREQLDEEGKGTVRKWWTTFWTIQRTRHRFSLLLSCHRRDKDYWNLQGRLASSSFFSIGRAYREILILAEYENIARFSISLVNNPLLVGTEAFQE